MSKHRYIVWIDPQDVVGLFRTLEGPGCVAMPSLQACRDPLTGERFTMPPDVRVVDATYSWERGQIGLRIEHDSFPEVRPGEPTPWLPLTEVRIELLPARRETEDGPLIVEAPR